MCCGRVSVGALLLDCRVDVMTHLDGRACQDLLVHVLATRMAQLHPDTQHNNTHHRRRRCCQPRSHIVPAAWDRRLSPPSSPLAPQMVWRVGRDVVRLCGRELALQVRLQLRHQLLHPSHTHPWSAGRSVWPRPQVLLPATCRRPPCLQLVARGQALLLELLPVEAGGAEPVLSADLSVHDGLREARLVHLMRHRHTHRQTHRQTRHSGRGGS